MARGGSPLRWALVALVLAASLTAGSVLAQESTPVATTVTQAARTVATAAEKGLAAAANGATAVSKGVQAAASDGAAAVNKVAQAVTNDAVAAVNKGVQAVATAVNPAGKPEGAAAAPAGDARNGDTATTTADVAKDTVDKFVDKTTGGAASTADSNSAAQSVAANAAFAAEQATKPVVSSTTATPSVEVVDNKNAASRAANAANKKQRNKKTPFMNKIIEFAPAVNVTFGDDIDDDGACSAEIAKLCDDVDEGESALADCLSDYIAESENSDGLDDADAVSISDKCREEVYQFKIVRNSNINHNVPLAKACKVDAEKFCNVTWFFGYKAGQVISCLRDVKSQVSKPCNAQLFKVMLAAAVDFRVDPMLYEACKEDADSLCKGLKNGGGRIQACLRDKRMQLSWSCEEQLFRQEMENADDIRLSVRLFSRCLGDKRRFCKDVEPGNAKAKDCLEDHRAQLSSACKEEMDSMIERRVRDFRLDSRLRTACENEIFNMCAYFGDLDDIDTYDSSVINCLQDYQSEIKTNECRRQVKKYVELASSDIRFDVPLAEACYDDRQKFCSNVPPGSARVIRCLTSQREQLSSVCRATLFDEEVRFSENIDFQAPMKEACEREIGRFCKNVPHGNGKVIRCLQDNKGNRDFGKACREEVEDFESEISKDYRLNTRLSKACQKDIGQLCSGLCAINDGAVCGGKVLRCLTEKIDNIRADECKREVRYFEKMEVSNFKNDIILAQSCRQDVEKFCANVEPGEGRVHACLRENRKKLTPACRAEELLLEEKEADSIELALTLMKTCKAERELFCKDVAPGQARVFRCLAENMNDADFGNQCKYQIIHKLQRRQANWKLDPPLRKACRVDVAEQCSEEDTKNSEDGLVYKCLIRAFDSISSGCQKELGRAVHMAFYVWQPALTLTSDCDEDIAALCLSQRPNMANRPGAVGTCLANILEKLDAEAAPSRRRMLAAAEEKRGATLRTSDGALGNPAAAPIKLSKECHTLATIAEPPNMKAAFESSLSSALLVSHLEKVEDTTGLSLVSRNKHTGDAQGISLTGWMATLGMTAMVVLMLYGSWSAYRHLRGVSGKDYTLVVKSGAR